jgi:membrane associated rhomboid family serine protease
MIPIRTDAPLRTTPYVNWAIIAVNVVVFLGQTAATRGESHFFDHLVLDPFRPRLYQYFTSMFMHASLLHIGSNMLFLYIFGNSVCDKMRGGNYLLFYLAGGVFAGIAHVLFSDSPVLGASGAISAVTGAYLILFPRASVTIVYFFILIGTAEIPGVLFVLFFFLLDVFKQFQPGLFGGQEAVAHMAHIGGSVFGIVTSSILLRLRLLPRDAFDAVAILQRWNRRRQFRDVVASGYNPFGYVPKPREHDPRSEQIQDVRAEIGEAIAHGRLVDAGHGYRRLLSIDPEQVLSRSHQLDLANHFFAEDRYPEAAGAYESYLKTYGKHDPTGHVQFMLGLVYARYLKRPDAARQHLTAALEKLRDPDEIAIAREELDRISAESNRPTLR